MVTGVDPLNGDVEIDGAQSGRPDDLEDHGPESAMGRIPIGGMGPNGVDPGGVDSALDAPDLLVKF
jgi:hypothetical protein